MNRGELYDEMIENASNDELGLFEKYYEIMQSVQNRIRAVNPIKVYDLGCGTGNLSGPLSDEMNVLGVDMSLEMLIQANMKYPNLYTSCYDMETFLSQIAIQPKDLLTCGFVLHGVANKQAIWSGFEKAIKSGGTVLLLDYFFKTESAQTDRIEALQNNGKTELADLIASKHYLALDELTAWSEQHNFKLEFRWMTHWVGMAICSL